MAFDIRVLLDEASRRSRGLTDFGDDAFRPALERLLSSLDGEARLSAAGREMLTARIIELLRNRLVLEDHIRRHPDILEEENENPIVIVGLPRTGTTLLQRIDRKSVV